MVQILTKANANSALHLKNSSLFIIKLRIIKCAGNNNLTFCIFHIGAEDVLCFDPKRLIHLAFQEDAENDVRKR